MRWASPSTASAAGSSFFFQAEDGLRDVAVTGVQTCALPILPFRKGEFSTATSRMAFNEIVDLVNAVLEVAVEHSPLRNGMSQKIDAGGNADRCLVEEIGRASCRESVGMGEGVADAEEEA